MKIRAMIAVLALAFAGTGAVAETILVVAGGGNDGEARQTEWALDDLDALEQVTIETRNNYVDTLTSFTGPRMQTVLEGLEYDEGSMIKATALNDYFVSIPASDFLLGDVILATRRDGELMSLRDKGPIWIIYQTEQYSEETTPSAAMIHNRLIWQLRRLEVQ